jgi:hypothetical protein
MPIDDLNNQEPFVEPGELRVDEFGKKILEPLNWHYFDDDPVESVPDEIYNARASDLNMQERAIRERWPITPEKRAEMIARAQEIVQLAKSPRTKLAAMKVLLMADAMNLKSEEQPGQHVHIHGGEQESAKDVARKLMMDTKYIAFLRTLEDNEKAQEESVDDVSSVENNLPIDFNQISKEAGETNAEASDQYRADEGRKNKAD